MLHYSDYKKSRRVFETLLLINSGQVTTNRTLVALFETTIDIIENYVDDLNSDFQTGIYIKRGMDKYVIEQEGIKKMREMAMSMSKTYGNK